MAEIERLEDRKKGEEAAAPPALEAEYESEIRDGGQCLSSKEIADVVTGICTAEAKEAALAHFGTCRKCYEAWVAMSFSIAAVQRDQHGKKRTFSSLRAITYIGTAFVIAAGFVAFLSVRDVVEENRVSPAPSASPSFSAQKTSEVSIVGPRVTVDRSESAGPVETLSADQWLSIVEKTCLSGEADAKSLQGLELIGRKVSGAGQNGAKRRMRVLELLAGVDTDAAAAEQCARIRALLAEGAERE